METENKLVPTDVLKSVFQIGIVVPDLDKAIDNMRQVLEVEPTSVTFMDYPNVFYRGKEVDAKARVAAYDQFGVQLEFIEPVGDDDTIWKDYLDKYARGGYALHHIRFNDVDNNDVVTDLMADHGVEVYQEGGSIVNPGGKFTYYDTAELLGFATEVVTKRK